MKRHAVAAAVFHWLNPVSVSWVSVSSWSLDCGLTSCFWKSRCSFFCFVFLFWQSWGLPFHRRWQDSAPHFCSFPSGYSSRCDTAAQVCFFFYSTGGRKENKCPVSLPCPKSEATSLVKKGHFCIHSLEIKGTRGTWKRLQESTMLISASLKWHPSAASQALARQQTLTRIKIDNLEKNTKKRKTKTKKIHQNENIMDILYNCQKHIDRL